MLSTSNIVSSNGTVTSETLRHYFAYVINVAQNGNEFSINLDDVWPLGYTMKHHAVRDLRKKFIESVDYKPLTKNGEWLNTGRVADTYMLTPQCMEFLIARKNREVFEVYRQVFHKAFAYAKKQHEDKKPNKWLPTRGFSDTFVFDTRYSFVNYNDVVEYFNIVRHRHESGCMFPVAVSEIIKMIGMRLPTDVHKIMFGKKKSAHIFEEDLDFYFVDTKIIKKSGCLPHGNCYLSVRAFQWLLEEYNPSLVGMLFKVFETFSLPVNNRIALCQDKQLSNDIKEAMQICIDEIDAAGAEVKSRLDKVLTTLNSVNLAINI